jgi:hypothetical protein
VRPVDEVTRFTFARAASYSYSSAVRFTKYECVSGVQFANANSASGLYGSAAVVVSGTTIYMDRNDDAEAVLILLSARCNV